MRFLRRLFGREAPPAEEEAQQGPAPSVPVLLDTPPLEAATVVAAPAFQEADEAVAETAEVEDIDPHALIDTGPLEERARRRANETAPLVADHIPFGATRQLPLMEEGELVSNLTLSFGHSLNVGRVRATNQDAVVACAVVTREADRHANFGLFAIADGMGGHLDGEKASAQVASTVTERIVSQIYFPLLQQEQGRARWFEETAEHIAIGDVLVEALQAANSTIISKIPNSGTTATLVVIIGNTAHLAHIGDSRAYLISQSGIQQITRDHSLAQRLFEVGQLSREEMETFTRRNELYKVLGFAEDVEPDVSSRRLPPGSYLLLCSDGLWSEVPDSLIQDVVLNAETSQAACDRLVDLANERGGHDNISVVVVQVPSNV